MKKKKLRVGILFGGRSGEHEVSLLSASSILKAIDRKRYEVVPILATLPDTTPGILEPACDRDETLESVTRKASTVFSDHARLVGQLRLI